MQNPTNGYIATGAGETSNGSIVRFACNSGYTLDGKDSITCSCYAHGGCLWNFPPPTCQLQQQQQQQQQQVKECREPSAIEHGGFEGRALYTDGTQVKFSCQSGYNLQGTSVLTCRDEKWSGEQPSCSPVNCGNPGSPQYGYYSRGSRFTFPSELTFQCYYGFELRGSRTIRCQADGSWSNHIPVCSPVSCGNPVSSEANLNVEGTRYTLNAVLIFSCDPDYKLVDGSASRIMCLPSKEWSGTVPQCELITCIQPVLPSHCTCTESQTAIEHGFPVHTRLDFVCDEGYRIIGAPSITCTQSGLWSHQLPDCQVMVCDNPGTISHGSRSGVVFTYGSTISFSCDPGYHLNGPKYLGCLANGRWNDTLPSCTDDGCRMPDSPEHGSIEGTESSLGDTIVFKCGEGYHLIGESIMTCNGVEWNNDMPYCKATECANPGHPLNGYRVGESFSVGATVSFGCNDGYELDSSSSISSRYCTAEARWNQQLPTCVAKKCDPPPNPEFGSKITTNYDYGSRVKFVCFRGHKLVGSDVTQCQQDGTWSNPIPSCIPCGLGFYKENVRELECSPCPDGSQTSTETSTSRLQCICEGDTTGPAGGPCTEVRCDLNPPVVNGKWETCNMEFNGECILTCDGGYVIDGSRIKRCLQGGWFPPEISSCKACPKDTYSTAVSYTTCLPCPQHSSTPGDQGGVSINSCLCDTGYRRFYLNGPCEDVNECLYNDGGCTGRGAICENRDGTHRCKCTIPGYKLDDDQRTCVVEYTCTDEVVPPENGIVTCLDNLDSNSRRCQIQCNEGFYLATGNNYVTCGSTSKWHNSHQILNRTATLPPCLEEFFVDTLFNVTTQIKVATTCEDYIENLPASLDMNAILQENGQCGEYNCNVADEDVFLSCSNGGNGISLVTIAFTIYLENPVDAVTPDCNGNCQIVRLRTILVDTQRLVIRSHDIFAGEVGTVMTSSGAVITLKDGNVTESMPALQCHERGRVFTKDRLCVPCPEGYYLPSRTASSCLPCESTFYQDERSQTSCKRCPIGFSTLGKGATSLSQCVNATNVEIFIQGLENSGVILTGLVRKK